jgi:hypothetical protein
MFINYYLVKIFFQFIILSCTIPINSKYHPYNFFPALIWANIFSIVGNKLEADRHERNRISLIYP